MIILLWKENGIEKRQKFKTKKSFDTAWNKMIEIVNEKFNGAYIRAGDSW